MKTNNGWVIIWEDGRLSPAAPDGKFAFGTFGDKDIQQLRAQGSIRPGDRILRPDDPEVQAFLTLKIL